MTIIIILTLTGLSVCMHMLFFAAWLFVTSQPHIKVAVGQLIYSLKSLINCDIQVDIERAKKFCSLKKLSVSPITSIVSTLLNSSVIYKTLST